ncbi:hypothetical protein [Streptomyces sp. NPDC005955]|uniref:hypothetical protein n=1 Tax=Streptomyces sp. NPDC005955 TaxID=3364738 RepID=UPI0036809791
MSDDSSYDPILPHVKPVPGGLYGSLPYEVALANLRDAVALISAALPDADPATEEDLLRQQWDLNRAQLQLHPGDTEAIERANAMARTVRRLLAGEAT